MSTVSFKRSANVNEIPIVDGQLVFDETHNKIYMDNGTERLQYGGDVSLIEDISYATSNNTFSANGSLNLFTQKLSVIDNKESALAVTQQHIPVGCLAFQSTIGNANYSAIGNTISDSLVTLKNNLTSAINSVNSQLSANDNEFYFDYQNGKYGYNTDPNRGADTFNPFKSSPIVVGTFTGSSANVNVDIHQAITNAGYDYTSLTNDDFIIQATGSSASGGNASGWYGTSVTIGKSYNASTGVMTVTGVNASTPTQPNGSVSVSVSGNILLIG